HELAALPLRENPDGRTAADHAVALGDGHTALFGNVAGERAADEIQRTQRNDIRIEKKIAQEWLDGFERVWTAQLKKDDAHAFLGASVQVCHCSSLPPDMERPLSGQIPISDIGYQETKRKADPSPASRDRNDKHRGASNASAPAQSPGARERIL